MEEKKQPRIKILVACHKEDQNIRQDDIYMPIQVGKALHPELDLGFQCDNTGDNISEKNGSYCELTALYWAWKNLKDVDYIGLCHYRRYFYLKDKRIFSNDKIILPYFKILPTNVMDNLSMWTSLEDCYILFDSIISLYPEYRKSVVEYYLKGNAFSLCNMFIAPVEIFNSYCSFLFTVLGKIETKIKMYPFTRQNRLIGYLAETLLGLWILHNHIPHNHVYFDGCVGLSNVLKTKIGNIRNKISFFCATSNNRPNKLIMSAPVSVGFQQDAFIIENI